MGEDTEIEASIIAILLRDLRRIVDIASIVKPNHFYTPKYRNLYTSVLTVWSSGAELTLFSVLERCRSVYGNHHNYDKISNDIVALPARDDELEARAKKLSELHSIRRLERALASSLAGIRGGSATGSQALAEIESEIRKIADEEASTEEVYSSEECLGGAVSQIERAFNGEVVGIPTHIKAYNGATGGMVPEEWTVLAGRPGTGKTALALDVLDEVSLPRDPNSKKKHTLFFSLEMSRTQLMQRLIAKRASVDLQKMRTGRLTQDELGKIADAAVVLKDSKLMVNDDPSVTTYDIMAIAYKIKNQLERNGETLDLIVIDNLSILRPAKPSGSRISDVSEMTRDIKIMAKKLKVHIIVIVHLNRNIENRGDGIPRLADLRECGSIEQDADIVVALHKPDEGASLINAHLLKNRGGPSDVIPMKGDLKHMRFSDYEIAF